MAKAAEIPLHPDMTFAEAAALTVAVRAEELFAHSENVLDTSDIERVHAMRVATRRLELHPERVRLLPAGMLLLDAAAGVLGAPLQVARGGLREGVLLEALWVDGVPH